MAIVKGQNLRLMVGTGSAAKCIALATSCSIHIALQTESTATKDSTGDWDELEAVGKSWDASCDALVAPEDNGSNGELITDLRQLILNGTKCHLVFDVTAGANNRVAQGSPLKMEGDAYLNDWNVTSSNRESVKGSFKFQGTGALS